jgi:DNA-binding response OmpR family regulator
MNKLLIVDDSDDPLEVMKNILEYNGYTVKILNSTNNVYNEVSEFQPDLIILDIFLAGENENKDLRVLVFSASLKHLEDYESYSADDFIEKPFDKTHLMEKIESVLHRQFVHCNVT